MGLEEAVMKALPLMACFSHFETAPCLQSEARLKSRQIFSVAGAFVNTVTEPLHLIAPRFFDAWEIA